jgi:hypothetical protein
VNAFARIVVGYHGCLKPFADRVLSGELPVSEWQPSKNPYDWLGHGIYFWEHGPARARRWAEEKAAKDGGEPAVIGALIQLGDCLDLTDEQNTANLTVAYNLVKSSYDAAGKALPINRGPDGDLKGRKLDCLIINYYLQEVSEMEYQTVRGVFREGAAVFDGSMIYRETHVQVAVVDPACILGVFHPT